ncbi:hypothetical protein [Actinoplanes sp. DH11]|uniref:hypothetical protein n=1 Tax=Actinoplanes sp. DH11 TaxID=2857011 RepID=UPI001E4D10B0|nr:hypothetical protein [Actinoplanes sp. DH11]
MRERSLGARLILWAQWFLLVACLVGSLGVLVMAAVRAGDPAALVDPGLERLGDPKDSLPDSPLVLLLVPGMFVGYFVFASGFVAVLFGLGALMHTWNLGDRATARRLIFSTGAWVLLTAAALTPFGDQLHRWLLD